MSMSLVYSAGACASPASPSELDLVSGSRLSELYEETGATCTSSSMPIGGAGETGLLDRASVFLTELSVGVQTDKVGLV